MIKDNPIILPLDGMDREKALETAKKFTDKVWGFKINDLLDKCDPRTIIKELKEFGNVFADPKFLDIPNTVANRVKPYAEVEADLLTIHAKGGINMMKAAVGVAKETKILAVTELTSLDEEEIHIGSGQPSKASVLMLARNAVLSGVPGIVCSAKELEILSKHSELAELFKATPGIRPDWYQKADDQKRVMTPGEAIKLGANFLVIGRPILKDKDPLGAVEKTLEEIQEARRVSGGDCTTA